NLLNLKRVKILAIALMALSLLVVGYAVSVQKAHADGVSDLAACPTLSVGSSAHSCVMILQAALNSNGASPALTVDGSFGPMTKAAVMTYQTAHSLLADGVVGAHTKAALM